MNPKGLFAPVLLLAILVQLAPIVHSCINLFAAQGESNGVPQATWLDGKLWDNPDSNGDPMCTLGADGPYVFGCAAGYGATLDIDYNVLYYNTPHGDYSFAVTYDECGGSENQDWCSTYQACALGCSQGNSDCFAYGCTQPNYSGCGP